MRRKGPEVVVSNRIQEESWFPGLRMYGPLEPWIEKTWRPSEIELVK
jgi:hypothetical protein